MLPARRYMLMEAGSLLSILNVIMNNNHNNHGNNHVEARKRAFKFLKENKTAVLATASRDGGVQAATLFYSVDDDFTFNFITDNKSRKFLNLKENPHVAIVVGIGPEVTTIQCGGHVEIVDYLKELPRAAKIIRKVYENSRLHGGPPSLPVLMNPGVELGVFIVKPEWMTMLNLEYNKDPGRYEHEYSKIPM